MKELLIDFTMVGLLLFCMNGLLNNHYIQNEMVSKNIVAFEQNVQKQKEVNLTAYSVVGDDKKQAVRLSATLSTSDNTNDSANQFAMDNATYMSHKAEVRKDITAFQNYVYEQEDLLASEMTKE